LKITGKMGLLFLATAIVFSAVVTLFLAQSLYRGELNKLLGNTQAAISGRPSLQLQIYQRDQSTLSETLGGILAPGISYAIAYDNSGQELAVRNTPNVNSPSFKELRAALSAAETGLSGLNRGRNLGSSYWSSLRDSQAPLTMTVPVFSAINPAERNLAALDFAQALTKPSVNGSLLVIGYIQLGIDRSALLDTLGPPINQIIILCLVVICLLGGTFVLFARRITRPLKELEALANDISSGNARQAETFEGGREFANIANLINNVIGGMHSYKQEIGAGQHLMELRADENASQLSRRNEELSKATEEISRTKSQLNQLAYYDSLTSLPNRRLFTEQLAVLLKLHKREQKPIALLTLNLDNFKRINESLGHSAGDLLLREVGKRMTACLRDSDLLSHYAESKEGIDVSRLGSDEFTVVLNQLDSTESAAVVAQRLIKALVEPVTIDSNELVVTPSIGIAIAPRDAEDVEGLLKAAGLAMHQAKQAPGQDFLYYQPEMDSGRSEQIKLESDLRRALEAGQLLLHYQPQVDTVRGSVTGAEALLRWQHPELGMIPPLKFIALAEQIGLIGELGDWVLVEACRQLGEFKRRGVDLPRVAINVSLFQFNSTFAERVQEVLSENDLAPSMLELGLSEELLANTDSDTLASVQALAQAGVYLSVDNFGTGSAPLSYLGQLPISELKIDRSFVRDCHTDEGKGRLVKAMIAMAGNLGFKLVAEGVETREQCLFLNAHGASVVQGYLFSKAVTANELIPLLVPWHFMEQIQGFAAQTNPD
jgi:diguanylate cyclase (GGDEF)-like protein